MKLKVGKLHLATAFATLSLGSMAALAAVVEVTVENASSTQVTAVGLGTGETEMGLPSVLSPGRSGPINVTTSFSSSWIKANYASGKVSGGCKFVAEHKEYSTGPVYTSSATAYGEMGSSSCLVYLTEKWSKPYNYKVRFIILQ